MATLAEKNVLRRGSYLDKEERQFSLPNPGDVFMVVAFGWAALCFAMVTGGQRLARQAARLSGSDAVRDLILTEQTAIAALMIVGLIGIAAAFYFFTRFKLFTIGLFFFCMSFAAAAWRPLHDFAFAFKYLMIIYLGAYAALFFLKNGWRMIGEKGYRLICIFLAWMAFIAAINGLQVADLWYLGTEFVLMVGFGVAWLSYIEGREDLEKLNKVVGITAVFVTFGHLISPLVGVEFTSGGRFVSMFERATGFATIYAVFVVALFWMSMQEQRQLWHRFYQVMALIGFALILWSGTRNATVAVLLGVGALWWVFRSRIFVFIVAAGIFGLLLQIILAGSEDLDFLSSRLASTDNTRLELWALYAGLAAKSPLVGYGPSGLFAAVYGETSASIISNYARLYVPGVHNHYLGFAVRFGFIGLLVNMAIFYFPLRVAWRVIFSKAVSIEDKQQYILPVTMLVLVGLQGLFEDTMGSTGRGTVHGLVMACAIPLVYIYGRRLLDESGQQKQASDKALAIN